MNRAREQRVVTWEAADRGASCCLGCWAWVMILGGAGLGVWYVTGGAWKLAIGLLLMAAGAGVLLFMRSSRRGRWEIRFDRDRREVTLFSRKGGEEITRVIAFDEIVAVQLEQIKRDVSTGGDVPHLRPVLYLRSGEQVPLDERLSVKRPERADEVLRQMREILGLDRSAPDAEGGTA